MFVAWQRKPLSASGALREHDDCAHARTGLGREKITPVVRRSFRLGGKPRNEVICRPAGAIRRCCAESSDDPVARVRFWRAFERKREETLRTADRDVTPWLVAAYVGNHGWLRRELAEVVRPPTVAESELVEAMPWPMFGEVVTLEDIARERAECLAAAVERRARWRAARRPGEPYLVWAMRDLHEAVDAEARAKARADAFGAPAPSSSMTAGDAALTLGLTWPCSADVAKAAYRRAMLGAHPDRGGSPEAFRRVQAAYDEMKLRLGVL